MTTIAFRDGIMAGDRQGSLGGLKLQIEKLHKIKHQGLPMLFGGAGSMQAVSALRRWILEGAKKDELPTWAYKDDDHMVFQCLTYDKVRGLCLWNWAPIAMPLADEYFAVGSGAAAAMGAMHMGASAEKAVFIASLVDEDTGRLVDTISLET